MLGTYPGLVKSGLAEGIPNGIAMHAYGLNSADCQHCSLSLPALYAVQHLAAPAYIIKT